MARLLNNPLSYCFFAAFFFGTWPLIARFANLRAGWLALVFSIGTGVIAASGLARPIPPGRSLLIGIVAGAVNGIGMMAFAKLIDWKEVEVSKFIPIIFALMPVVSTIEAALFFNETMAARKLVGLALAFIAVYLLS